MCAELRDEYKSGVSIEEFQAMVTALNSEENFEDGHEIFYKIVNKVVKNKCKQNAQGTELDDLVQDTYVRLFTRISEIAVDPIGAFSKDGRVVSANILGGCFHNYIVSTAMNILRGKYRKNVPIVSIDEDESGDFFLKLISSERDMAEAIGEAEYTVSIYRLCLKNLFTQRSKPYIVLGFCFNALIHFDESGHSLRGCSSYTAEAIAKKTLGTLRNEFFNYHSLHLRSIPADIIAPFDKKLETTHSDGVMYKIHITETFYGKKPEHSIADWTNRTRSSLLERLRQEPMIVEFINSEEFKLAEKFKLGGF